MAALAEQPVCILATLTADGVVTQDLEAFLAGRKDTTRCLPAGIDITFPPAKRLRTEHGNVAGECLKEMCRLLVTFLNMQHADLMLDLLAMISNQHAFGMDSFV